MGLFVEPTHLASFRISVFVKQVCSSQLYIVPPAQLDSNKCLPKHLLAAVRFISRPPLQRTGTWLAFLSAQVAGVGESQVSCASREFFRRRLVLFLFFQDHRSGSVPRRSDATTAPEGPSARNSAVASRSLVAPLFSRINSRKCASL